MTDDLERRNDEEYLDGEKIEIQYVPVSSVLLWEDNPKRHDIGAIVASIEKNGFRDPPTYDATLNALVEGNGRATALNMMEKQGRNAPRGVLIHRETGAWYMPINFGINSETRQKAIAYAIDHNNLTLAGGDFTAYDMARMWEKDGLNKMLSVLIETGEEPVSMSSDDMQIIVSGFDFEDFAPIRDMTDEEDEPEIKGMIKDLIVKVHHDEAEEASVALREWVETIGVERFPTMRYGYGAYT